MQKVKIVIISILIFYLVSCSVMINKLDDSVPQGNVAVIPINGVISFNTGFSDSFDYEFVTKSIREAEERPDIKAIVLSINSPGGTAVASDEIGQLIKKSEKPTVAWIREVGASGAYWIATNTDYIITNRMTITGSIGVVASYLEFSEFLERYNVTYQRMVSGKYKDLGSPFKKLDYEEEALLQNKIDKIHEFFVLEVVENRALSNEEVETLATGAIYLGVEAKELGLVDELGGIDEVIAYLGKKIGEEVTLAYYEDEMGIYDLLTMKSANPLALPEGIQLR